MSLSRHPANLILRSFLLIVSLVVIGQWGWQQRAGSSEWIRYALALGLPLLFFAVWTVFKDKDADEGDQPNRFSIPVSGGVRLALELLLFGAAVWAANANGTVTLGLALFLSVLLHYFWSADRISKLLNH